MDRLDRKEWAMSDNRNAITTTEWIILAVLIIEISACAYFFQELASCQSFGHNTMDCIMVMGIE